MKINEINSFPPLFYQANYSKIDFEKLSKFFLLFNDIKSINSEIERRIKENLFTFEVNENEVLIKFNIEILSINSFSFKLPLKDDINVNVNLLIRELFKKINNLENKVEKLENENKEIKSQLNELNK